MKYFLKTAIFFFCCSFHLNSAPYDFIYPNQGPSFSNYGTLGLLSNPNARFLEEGSLGFTWSKLDPYLRGSIVAYPFDWFEASYGYTDVNNKLYSDNFEFSGNQTLKDKGFDAKFRLLKETERLPAVALGLRDMAGTGLFSAEYLVASKNIGWVDITLGMGWGTLSKDRFSNPLSKIHNSFETREIEGSIGGELSTSTFFSGDIGIFGGAEIFLPYLNGARIKLEYDGTDYTKEGFPPIKQAKSINFGLVYPVSKNVHLKLGIIRGNTLNVGFSFSGNYGKKTPFIPKIDPHEPVKNSKIIQMVTKDDDRLLYLASLRYLSDRKLYLQAAEISEDRSEYSVAYSQSKYMSYTRATGRVLQVLDKIAPENIKTFKITSMNAGLGQSTVTIPRNDFQRKTPYVVQNEGLSENNIEPSLLSEKNYSFQPTTDLPKNIYKFSPSLRSQIGGPDGFYFGDLRFGYFSEILLSKNMNISTIVTTSLVDNFDELKLASNSILPHVRTDIVKYLKQSKHFAIEKMQFNYFTNPLQNIYAKVSGGILEDMFGGIGGEILYKPFYKNWGVSIDLWRVRQREYDMRLKFQDYSTTTGFLNLYYHEQNTNILLKIKGGKFLARDSGIKFDFSRHFSNGTQIGAFFTITDISKEEFGEGSFDKGFYFAIPVETFFTTYSRGFTGFGLRPITRDGGAHLSDEYNLWGISDQSSVFSLLRNWSDMYD
jgi:hypothetical protein